MRTNSLAHTIFDPSILDVLKIKWNEPHRFYHNYENHLTPMLDRIYKDIRLSASDKSILEIAAYFHDSVYDPRSMTNEYNSIKFFTDSVIYKGDEYEVLNAIDLIKLIIFDTKEMAPFNELSKKFMEYDLWNLLYGNTMSIIEDGKLIFKEFQFYDFKDFKVGRVNFLKNMIKEKKLEKRQSICDYFDFMESWRPNVGIYAGSFYPLHKGHINIKDKAEQIFDKVIFVQAQNPDKGAKTDGEYNNISLKLKYYQVEYLSDNAFITDFMREQEKNCNTTLIRGLRNGYDFAYELNQFRFLQDLCPTVKTVFIPCDREFDYLSSSAVRDIEKIHKGAGKRYI